MSREDRPYEKLIESATALVRDELSWLREEAAGDSPIEKILATAINIVGRFGCREHDGALWPADEEAASRLMGQDISRSSLIVMPQVQVDKWRVDFLVSAYHWEQKAWRSLIVECDGHDYHERTKEQARRDRRRDREVQRLGKYRVFRFTGSEIWNDPWECAVQIYEWAAEGV